MHSRLNPALASVILSAAGSLTAAQSVHVEKYALPNGMTVILHEDRSLPVATVNIWYRVGAQDEPPGRSGFAHLFEHLMFMGTQRVPGSDFDILMERGGGANNASTDLHRTNYYSWGPSSLLPTLLWLDADRLEDMGLNMNQEKLDKQRDVVRNELRQNVENRPYGKAEEAVWALMFPSSHPYFTGVIGTHEDLEAANVTNVKDFFANFYVPSNASMVVAGNFSSAEIKPLIANLFGSLPPGQPVTRKYNRPGPSTTATPALKLDSVKRFTAIDKVQLPKISFVYHSPPAFSVGDAEMRLAAGILADGKASRLYKRLIIDEELAAEVSAAQNSYPLGSLFNLDVLALPGANLERVEAIIDEELTRFTTAGPTQEELDRFKSSTELAILSSLQSIQRKADALNEYEYYLGEPDSFKRDLDRYRNATTATVRDAAVATLTPDSRAIIRVLAEVPARESSPRDTRPADAASAMFTPPEPSTFTLGNGLRVHLWTRADLPLVAVSLLSVPGGALDPAGAPGAASLFAHMLTEGAGDLDSLAFENTLQALGGSFDADASEESLAASMTILKRNLPRGMSLFADAILRPRFDPTDWKRVHSIRIEDLKQADDQPGLVASKVASRLVFGDANPYSTPAAGTIGSVQSMTLDGVKSLSASLLNPANCAILIAGDIRPDEAKSLLEQSFAEWTPAKAAAAKTPSRSQDFSIPPHSALRLAIVDRPGATQTFIRFAAPGPKFDNPDRPGLEALNTILGGSFTSRLNQNLREKNGFTYGARSQFAMGPSAGMFTASASVQTEVTGPSLREFFNEFHRLSQGDIGNDETTKARETVRNDTVLGFGTLDGLIAAATERLSARLEYGSIAGDLAMLDTLQTAAINTLAQAAAARINQGVLVLVGDKAALLSQLEALNSDPNFSPKLPSPTFYTTDGSPQP